MTDYAFKRIQVSFFTMLLLFGCCAHPYTEEKPPPSGTSYDQELSEIINPFDAICHDWRGAVVPCDFKRQYAELLSGRPIPAPRFIDNKNGTVTDRLTALTWLKNMNCFEMMDWKSAAEAAKSLEEGDCGPNPSLVLSDGSSAGDWRMPTMNELCTLIDFSRRAPALPAGHLFSAVPRGFHWSATALDGHPEMAWIVYFESGTTCYDDVTSKAGHLLPVRNDQE